MKPRPDRIITRTVAQRRSENLQNMILAAVPAAFLGALIMVAVHIGLTPYADTRHEAAVAMIQQADAMLLTDCRKDLARYSEIAQLERDIVAQHEAGR